MYRVLKSVCNESVDYVELLIEEYVNYTFLFEENKLTVDDGNEKGEKTNVTLKNYSLPESVAFEEFITRTITKIQKE